MSVYYSRYVDDIFCVFNSIEYVRMFLIFVNNFHPNLKFTYKIGQHKLPFLETQMSLSSNNDFSLIRNVYRKPTDTKTVLNFHAVRSWILKSCSIEFFINIFFVYRACSNWLTYNDEISQLKVIFHMNGYPREIFSNHVENFLIEKQIATNSCQNIDDERKYTVISSFIGHSSMV